MKIENHTLARWTQLINVRGAPEMLDHREFEFISAGQCSNTLLESGEAIHEWRDVADQPPRVAKCACEGMLGMIRQLHNIQLFESACRNGQSGIGIPGLVKYYDVYQEAARQVLQQ